MILLCTQQPHEENYNARFTPRGRNCASSRKLRVGNKHGFFKRILRVEVSKVIELTHVLQSASLFRDTHCHSLSALFSPRRRTKAEADVDIHE